MASVLTTPFTTPTIADLLKQLGSVPAHRVLLRPVPGTATEQDVVEIKAREGRLCELVDGVLVEKAMGFRESTLAALLCYYLVGFTRQHDLGLVAGEAATLQLKLGLVRIPDVCFVSWDRLPGRKLPEIPIPNLVPDLAVEILSKSNSAREMERKLGEYFSAGVRLVWIIDPGTRAVHVFRSPESPATLDASHLLEGGDVLPGFALPLSQLFAGLD